MRVIRDKNELSLANMFLVPFQESSAIHVNVMWIGGHILRQVDREYHVMSLWQLYHQRTWGGLRMSQVSRKPEVIRNLSADDEEGKSIACVLP
jgi:hypothetical protein